MENDGAVRNEAGRLVIQIIKVIYRTKAMQLVPLLFKTNAITLVVQALTGAFLMDVNNYRTTSENSICVNVCFDAPAQQTKVFPIVQNESLVALTLLCTLKSETANVICDYHTSVIPSLKNILEYDFTETSTENPYSLESMANAAVLLKMLIEQVPGFESKLEGYTVVLEAIIKRLDVRDRTKSPEDQLYGCCQWILKRLQ
jgi:hypothetical protein